MSIFRVTKDQSNPYVMLNKQFIYDKQLSYKAKGVLAYILSRPDNWQIYEIEVIKHSKDGRDSVRSGIKELVELGYIIRHEKRNDKGQFVGYEYEVFEIPNAEKPMTENPTSDNPTLLINELLINENKIPYVEIVNYLNEIANTSYRHTSKKTKDLIKARWNEEFRLEDFKKVIDKKVNEWNGTKYEKYIRPETLFGSKFESYLNQKENIFDEIIKPKKPQFQEQAALAGVWGDEFE